MNPRAGVLRSLSTFMEIAVYLLHHLRENVRDARHLGPRFLLRHVSWLRRDDIPVRVSVSGIGPLVLRRDSEDLGVVRDVLREDGYRIPSPPHDQYVDGVYDSLLAQGRRPLIIDAGANNGASAAWFAVRYPRALIVAVEPDPYNVQVARANTAQFGVQVVLAAIGSRSGRVALVTEDRSSDAVQTVRGDDGAVPVVTVPDIIGRQPDGCALFIVKVDIEGFESDLFARDTEWVGDTTVLYVEPHDYLFPGRGVTRGMQAVAVEHDLELLVARGNLVYVNRAGGRS